MHDPTPVPLSDSTSPAPENPEQPKPSLVRRIFCGEDGIRVGWRLALYLLMVVAVGFALFFVRGAWHPKGTGLLWVSLVDEAIVVLAAVIPGFIMARIEKRSFGEYGLPASSAFRKDLWAGAVWGIVAITLLLVVIRGLHGFYFGHLALHGVRIVKFTVFWAVFFLLVGLFEDFLFRGYTQYTLTKGIGFWPAAILLSTIFGAVHLKNPGEAWVGGLSAGLIGFFFCFTLCRTGTLWFAVGMHASWDWGESFLYSVPDSGAMSPGHLLNSSFHGPRWLTGGSVGPEGSVFVFVIIALLWVAFNWAYPEVKYPLESPLVH